MGRGDSKNLKHSYMEKRWASKIAKIIHTYLMNRAFISIKRELDSKYRSKIDDNTDDVWTISRSLRRDKRQTPRLLKGPLGLD